MRHARQCNWLKGETRPFAVVQKLPGQRSSESCLGCAGAQALTVVGGRPTSCTTSAIDPAQTVYTQRVAARYALTKLPPTPQSLKPRAPARPPYDCPTNRRHLEPHRPQRHPGPHTTLHPTPPPAPDPRAAEGCPRPRPCSRGSSRTCSTGSWACTSRTSMPSSSMSVFGLATCACGIWSCAAKLSTSCIYP